MKKLLFTLVFCLISSGAWAQCNGLFPGSTICGNSKATANPPTASVSAAYTGTNFVVCTGNGATDTAAIQAAMTDGVNNVRAVRFTGACTITSALSINGGLDFGGTSPQNSALFVNSGFNAITITATDPVTLHDFQLTYLSPVSTDTAITLTAGASQTNNNSRFDNLNIGAAGVGLNVIQGSNWIFSRSTIQGLTANGIGIHARQTVSGDTGGGTIVDSYITGGNGSTAAIEWESGGGLRVHNVVTNATAWSTAIIWINLAAGLNTSDIWITANELEGAAANNTIDCIRLTRQTSQGTLLNVHLDLNELGGCFNGINAPTDANGAWLTGVTAIGNVATLTGSTSNPGIGFNFGNAINGIVIGNGQVLNITNASSSQAIVVTGQTSVNCSAGPIVRTTGTLSPSTLGSCNSITPN